MTNCPYLYNGKCNNTNPDEKICPSYSQCPALSEIIDESVSLINPIAWEIIDEGSKTILITKCSHCETIITCSLDMKHLFHPEMRDSLLVLHCPKCRKGNTVEDSIELFDQILQAYEDGER